ELEALLDVKFEHWPMQGGDIDAYFSWDGGLEIIAPLTSKPGTGETLTKHIEQRGEGPLAIVVGVADLEEAAERARRLGYSVSAQIQSLDDTERRAHIRARTTKIDDIREISLGQFLGVTLLVGEVTYARS